MNLLLQKMCQGSSSQGSVSTKRQYYLKRWKGDFHWLEYDLQSSSVSTVKSGGSQILKLAGHGSLNLFATAKMKERAESERHIMACQTETAAASALCEGSVVQQMHRLDENENRLAIKSLLRCTHFIAHNHIVTLGPC